MTYDDIVEKVIGWAQEIKKCPEYEHEKLIEDYVGFSNWVVFPEQAWEVIDLFRRNNSWVWIDVTDRFRIEQRNADQFASELANELLDEQLRGELEHANS